jgi:hypothetical protein
MYRQNPLKWLPNLPKEDATSTAATTKSPEAAKKKESKKQR